MIVASMFEGDDDTHLAWLQHEVYDDALHVMVSTCNAYTRFARRILEDESHPDWGRRESFDHRTLQEAHDLLAGAWRCRNGTRQLDLPFTGQSPDQVAQRRWLDWLAAEVGGWIDHPHLIRSVQVILTNQNQPEGYAAEARLGLDILDRFADVPWAASHRHANEHDLSTSRGKLIRQQSGDESPSIATMMCECVDRGSPPCNQIPCRATMERAAREGWDSLE